MGKNRQIGLSVKVLIGCFCLVGIHAPSLAGFSDGQDLYSKCKAGEKDGPDSYVPFGICLGYITGVADLLNLQRMLDGKPNCLPHGLQTGTLRDVVMKLSLIHI